MIKLNSYEWRVFYDDGTILDQFEDDKEISSSSVDANKVVKMELIPKVPGRQPITLHVDIDKGERFIRFWRRYMVTGGVGAGEGWTKWVVGLQKTVEGKNVKFLVYINHDGVIEISSNPEL